MDSDPDLYIIVSEILIWCVERVGIKNIFKSNLPYYCEICPLYRLVVCCKPWGQYDKYLCDKVSNLILPDEN
jgi:hypothetical protein